MTPMTVTEYTACADRVCDNARILLGQSGTPQSRQQVLDGIRGARDKAIPGMTTEDWLCLRNDCKQSAWVRLRERGIPLDDAHRVSDALGQAVMACYGEVKRLRVLARDAASRWQ